MGRPSVLYAFDPYGNRVPPENARKGVRYECGRCRERVIPHDPVDAQKHYKHDDANPECPWSPQEGGGGWASGDGRKGEDCIPCPFCDRPTDISSRWEKTRAIDHILSCMPPDPRSTECPLCGLRLVGGYSDFPEHFQAHRPPPSKSKTTKPSAVNKQGSSNATPGTEASRGSLSSTKEKIGGHPRQQEKENSKRTTRGLHPATILGSAALGGFVAAALAAYQDSTHSIYQGTSGWAKFTAMAGALVAVLLAEKDADSIIGAALGGGLVGFLLGLLFLSPVFIIYVKPFFFVGGAAFTGAALGAFHFLLKQSSD